MEALTPFWLSPDGFFEPRLSDALQALVRQLYALLLLGVLIHAAPAWRRFFLSERWGGYTRSSAWIDRVQNPIVFPVLAVIWLGAALALLAGREPVWAAMVNLCLCRHFFIALRWRSVSRGMGAPGFMTYWLGGAVFLLELTRAHAPNLHSLALVVLQADFAFIIISSGLYKLFAGYRRDEGVDLGLVNPAWSYFWRLYRRLPPGHPLFRGLNQLGWSTEVIGGVLLLIPELRFVGALLIILGFLFVLTHLRLGWLPEMVLVATLLFMHPGSAGEQLLLDWTPSQASVVPVAPGVLLPDFLSHLIALVLGVYLMLLPWSHAGLAWNLYGRRSLPAPWQRFLEAYTNFFGMLVWRVFSVDLVNFFVRIRRRSRSSDESGETLTHYGWRYGLRYAHVAESITLTCVFTTLKYYPNHFEWFRERLLRYARTIPASPFEELVFEYIAIAKDEHRFRYVASSVFIVCPHSGEVRERTLVPELAPRPAAVSPVHTGRVPGSYAPAEG